MKTRIIKFINKFGEKKIFEADIIHLANVFEQFRKMYKNGLLQRCNISDLSKSNVVQVSRFSSQNKKMIMYVQNLDVYLRK